VLFTNAVNTQQVNIKAKPITEKPSPSTGGCSWLKLKDACDQFDFISVALAGASIVV
jgi:hypothetical protein